MIVRLPSLELNFLPLSLRKGMDVPEIIFCDAAEIGGHQGMYEPSVGAAGRLYVGADAENIEAVLAHEWRHHWQWRNQIFVMDWQKPVLAFGVNYWGDIVDYFSHRAHEHDALLFEIATAPIPVSEEWLIRCQQERQGHFYVKP